MNKQILIIVLILFFFASPVLAHPISSDSPYDDWRMFGRDTGFTRFTLSHSPLNISTATVRTVTFSTDVNNVPAIVWDSLYLVPEGYYSNKAYQLNASNISQQLSVSTNNYAISHGPTYYKNNLFFQADTYLYQVNISNLSQIINSQYIADSTGWDHIPVVYNNTVWTGAGNYNPYIKQINSSNVSNTINSKYIYGRPYEYIPIAGSYAYPSDVSSLWQVNSSNLSQQVATFSCSANNIEAGFSVANGFVYKACTISGTNYLLQLNASNISQQISNFSQKGWNYAVGNGYLYFIASNHLVYQLNASNISQQISTFNTTSWTYGAPAVTPEYVFVPSGAKIYQLNASNVSQLIGSYTTGGQIYSSPVVAKGFVYFGSEDNKLYQIGDYNPLPALKIDYPLDEIVYPNITQLNYSTMQNSSFNWDKCWYSNDSGVTNNSIQNTGLDFDGVSTINGWNNFTLFCNDSANNLYSEYTYFYIDTDIPIFTNASNKTINQTTALSHQITATDIGGVNCFSVNDTGNFSISCSGLLSNKTFLIYNNYSLNITVYDYANHYNSTIINVTVLDSIAPLLSITSPPNNTNSSNSGLDINYSLSDSGSGVNSCWYSNDSFSINYTLAGCANITSPLWSDGIHNLRLWVNDTSGNRNTTTLRFTIDTVAPIFNNLTNQSLLNGNNFIYQLNSTDATTNISCFSVNDTTNFNINCSGYLRNNSALNVGYYPINITVNDSVGNTNYSLLYVNVSTRPIIGLSLISPSGNINVTQNQTFSVSVNVSCSATDCGMINVSLDPIAVGTQYNFTTCGGTGASGPSQANCNTNYTSTNLAGLVNVTNGIQNWTVPVSGVYTLEVAGAKGGGSYPGNGSRINGTFTLTQGTILQILVGQIGPASTYGGGGGGSFVANGTNFSSATPLIVAGGGGGGSGSSGSYYSGINATVIINGTDGQYNSAMNNKGTNGNGGGKGTGTYSGGGGGGFNGNGTAGYYTNSGGKAFIYGGTGGSSSTVVGGFGGGGGNGWNGGGGGGGYSGGGGGYSDNYGGGGGGSYNLGTNQINTSGTNAGDGYVRITYIGGKGGLVSMNSSAIPFYTITQNPYNLSLNQGESQTITWTVNATGTINTSYEFFVYANMLSDMGVENQTAQWNVTITGQIAPQITIVYPSNNTNYTSNVSALNYTVTGSTTLSYCWYSSDYGAINSSQIFAGTNFTDLLSNEGINNWSIYCNDTAGNVGSNSITFYKDSILPRATLNSPVENYSNKIFNSSSLGFNCSATDNLLLKNISLYITNSTNESFTLNQTTNITGLANITNWTLSLGFGNYTWGCLVYDSLGNSNWSTNRTFSLSQDNLPSSILNSPENNSMLNKMTSISLNATVYDSDLDNLTIWFYGGYPNGTYNLINVSYNQTNGSDVLYNWTLGSYGRYNWTVLVDDGYINSTENIFFFNLTNISIFCEAGGPYQQGALILVQGEVVNEDTPLSSQSLNITIYDANENLIYLEELTTSDDGGFETSVSNLSQGEYALNASTSYSGINETCTDTFNVGGAASLVLDKITTLSSLSNGSIEYNITLKVTNKGASDATNTFLLDEDSPESPYNLETISPNTILTRSYLKNYTRNSSNYNVTLSIAQLNATDSYTQDLLTINSSEIILSVPALDLDQKLTITKNVYYNSENATAVNYTLSIDVVNSGGEDLTSIAVIDSDLNLITNINLNRTQNYTYSNYVIVDKAASNTDKTFVKTTATANTLTYLSNQIKVRIPGYGGPADAIVNAPTSIETSKSFSSVITVENQNPDIGQDFIIDYWITSQSESTNYSSGQQTIYVSALGLSTLTATLTSPSTAGTYRLRTIVTWAGGTATAYDTFTVTSTTTESTGQQGGGGGGSGSDDKQESNPSSISLTEEKSVSPQTTDIICNVPYIRYSKECCLDKNNNSICDNDDVSDLNKTEASLSSNTNSLTETVSNIYTVATNAAIFVASNSIIPLLIIFGIFGIYLLRKKIKFLAIIKSLFKLLISILPKQKKNFTSDIPASRKRVTDVKGAKVYTNNGYFIGEIREVCLEEKSPNIYGWMIKVNKEIAKKLNKSFILIRQDLVISINDVMILDGKVLNLLQEKEDLIHK